MNHLFQLTPILILVCIACKPGNNNADVISGDHRQNSTATISNTAINARDHIGLYKGILPCSDCEGIETSLYLMANNAYLLTKVYKGIADHKEFKNIGDFEWSEDGTTVTLSNIDDAPNRFIIGDTAAIQLDKQGKRVEGDLADMYILVKQ
jgi:uncharacterized lipoprotein NlpE involved in copper resistance